ncbi:MAG: hypothetical protein Q8M22_00525 [Actinomycetota bacterium]|nr:hypothetical protein [Actinomycetota bacterium]
MTRMPRPFAVLAIAVVGGLTVLAGCSGDNPYQAAESANSPATGQSATVDTTGTGIGDNEFLPDENLSSCVGTVQRPDCGSKSKGGWRMYLTFAVLMSGMGFIGWRITRSVRARDAVMNQVDEPAPEPVAGSPRD